LACHEKQNGGQSFNLRAWITKLWRFKARKREKGKEDDRLAIFKPGLWQTGFLGCSKEWYHFQQQLMVSTTIFKLFSWLYYFFAMAL